MVQCHHLYFLVITAKTRVQVHVSAHTEKKEAWQL